MYEYIRGEISEINPSYLVLEAGGVGFFINISLNTYSRITEHKDALEIKKKCKVFVHQAIREDAHVLFGFFDRRERDIFRLLISVSGIGGNTARMILSSMNTQEIEEAISTGNVNALKSVKGIGLKTAQRVVIDLKDKFSNELAGIDELFASKGNLKTEALSALTTLGFNKMAAEKMIDKLLVEKKSLSVEELVKECLRRL